MISTEYNAQTTLDTIIRGASSISSFHKFMEYCTYYRDIPNGAAVKNPPAVEMEETHVRPLGQDDPLEEEMATHSNILAWEIPWTEEPGGLQFIGSQRIRHN